MSKAIIGIKIADGSFYPILEEGKPGEKKLNVTTVRDDQTTVQINLYRSETGDMSDADYVDTLLIDNLVPHPKEEPSFDLIVKIDEDNMLSAEIDDPETGGKSDTKVSLVNMESKSIFDEPDYKITPEEQPDIPVTADEINIEEPVVTDSLPEFPTEDSAASVAEPEESGDIKDILSDLDFELPDDISGDTTDDVNFDLPDEPAPAANDTEDFTLPEDPITEDPVASEDFTLPEEPVIEEPAPDSDVAEVTEPIPTAIDEEDFSLPEEPAPTVSEIDDLTVPEESALPEMDDFSLPDFDSPSEVAEEPVATDTTDSLSDDLALPEEPAVNDTTDSFADDFALPEEPVAEDTVASEDFTVPEEPVVEEPVGEAVLSDDDFSFSTDFVDDEKDIDEDEKPFSFDSLPDFDEIPELSNSSESSMDDDLDIDFSVPETNNTSENSDMYSDYSEKQPEYDYAPSNNMQSALFGDSDLFEETKKQNKRKVLVPVIICILCAIISLGVLGVILYLTPSIMKIAGGMDSNSTAIETTISSTENNGGIAAEEEVVVEKPVVRRAEENEIVVLEKTVTPVVPENKNAQKEVSSIIRHLVKWGDTLWDLAGFYYRNPWLFRIISDANNLENPDLIISGTYLTIPDR